MNEKGYRVIIACTLVALFIGSATGFFIGRGDHKRSAELRDANLRLETALDELGLDLDRERRINNELRELDQRQRVEIESALDACGRLDNGLSGTIKKAEILLDLVRGLERSPGRYSDLPSSN